MTVFNWTDRARTHLFTASSLGLKGTSSYTVHGVFDKKSGMLSAYAALVVSQPPHSVRVLKIVDTSVAPIGPRVQIDHPQSGKTGVAATLTAEIANSEAAVVSYEWQMSDGVTLKGPEVQHTYTHPDVYTVVLTVMGIDGISGHDQFQFSVSGTKSTRFVPTEIRRLRSSE